MKKKKLISLLLVASMAFSLAACGSSGGDDKDADKGGDEKTLKVAAVETAYGADMWKEVCSAFEKSHEGVKVELTIDKKLEDVINPQMKSGEYPDVILRAVGAESGITETFVKDNNLVDLTDVLDMTVPGEEVTVGDKILPGFVENTITNPYGDGKTYLMPMFYGPCGLFYNAGLFEEKGWEVPETWDEMWALGDTAAAEGIALFLEKLTGDETGVIKGVEEISAIGFKTVLSRGYYGVHELTDEVMENMREYLYIAPVHNAAYIEAIGQFRAVLPDVPMIGVFETAFHREIPLERALYSIPYEWYEKYGIRKMGYHGASHGYIAQQAAKLGKAERVISCHLGGSCSICAILDGKSVDNSFGFSLQTGVMHANRAGDIDPYIVPFLMSKGMELDDILHGLSKNGGLLGVSGVSNDLREVSAAAADGNARAELAINMFVCSIVRFIGAYYAELGGLDQLIFTGGIGENSDLVRSRVCTQIRHLGVELDEERSFHNAMHDAYYTAQVLRKLPHPMDVLRYEEQPRKLCHNDRRSRFRVTDLVPSVREALEGEALAAPKCPTCGQPTKRQTALIPQAPGKYVALSRCQQHGQMFVKIRFSQLPDGQKGMHLSVLPANRQTRAYVHTKELQYQYRLKRGDYEHMDVEDLSAAYSSNMPFEDA